MQDLRIANIQSDLVWEDINANLKHFDQLLNTIEKVDLIVLPEMFSTGFSMNPAHLAEKMDGSAIQWMTQKAAKLQTPLVGSLIIEEEGNYYNRMVWMNPDGKVHTYDKRHLFSLAKEDDAFTGGSIRCIVNYKGWRFNLNICYDLRFPVWARNKGDYDCLIYVANWPERRSLAWKTLIRARAIENQSYVIASNRSGIDGNEINYSGDSAIIHPDGNTIDEISNKEGILYGDLKAEEYKDFKAKFQFWNDADQFTIQE